MEHARGASGRYEIKCLRNESLLSCVLTYPTVHIRATITAREDNRVSSNGVVVYCYVSSQTVQSAASRPAGDRATKALRTLCVDLPLL